MAHGFQEDLFQRVPAVRQLPHQQVLPGGELPDGFDLDFRRQHDTPAPGAFRHALGPDLRERRPQMAIVAGHLELDEVPVRATLFFEVALVHDRAVLQDHGLVADLLDVAQQVRAHENVHPLLFLHVDDELEHPPASGGIEPVGRFVQYDQLGPVNDRLRELGHLLHAVRVGPQLPVARLPESDMEEHLVRFLECRLRRKAGKLGHLADEGHRRHLPDERVVLGHVADSRPGFTHVVPAIEPQDTGAAGARPKEPEERQDQRGLAGPIGPEQSHRLSCARNAETAGDPVEDLPPS